MLPELLSRDRGRWRWAQAVGLFCVVTAVSTASADQGELRWQPSPARPYVVRGAERRLLDRAERFLDNQQWDDAIEALMRLIESGESNLVAIDEHRYVRLSEYCHRLLAKLPAEALSRYRRLVDATAETWYRQGIKKHDASMLRRVADQYLHSSWGDAALLVLGELELQRGHYQAARNAWMKIETSEVSADQALSSTDFELSPASVQARLALVAIREGNWQLAEELTEALGREHPQATGRLGGREVVLADYLSALLQQARKWPLVAENLDWQTFGGSFARTNVQTTTQRPQPFEFVWSQQIANKGLSIYPTVSNGLVIWHDGNSIHALNLTNGEEAFKAQGPMYQAVADDSFGAKLQTLTATDHYVFGVTTVPIGTQRQRDGNQRNSVLWSLDLERDGALALYQPSYDPAIAFVGAPLVIGTKLFVSQAANEQAARTGIACHDSSTGRRHWQLWLCQANTPTTGRGNEVISNLLTYDSGILYANTNLGAIVATRASDGEILWLRSYERTSSAIERDGSCAYYRGPHPCIVHQGLVYVLPTDSRQLLVLDAGSGELHWTHPVKDPYAKLIGVVEDRVVLADGSYVCLDISNGREVGRHEGDVLGKSVIRRRPPHAEVFIIKSKSGEQQLVHTLNVRDLGVHFDGFFVSGEGGANLALAGDYLVAAGKEELSVFKYDVPKETNAKVSQTSTKEKRE